jgi:hypothetical protein
MNYYQRVGEMPFEDRCKSLTSKIAEIFQDINQLNPYAIYL